MWMSKVYCLIHTCSIVWYSFPLSVLWLYSAHFGKGVCIQVYWIFAYCILQKYTSMAVCYYRKYPMWTEDSGKETMLFSLSLSLSEIKDMRKQKERRDEAIFSDIASFYAFVLTLQSFLWMNSYPPSSAEQQRRRWDRLTSISSTSTVSVFYVVHNLKKEKCLYHFAFKTVDCTIKVSERVCQKPFNQPRVNGVTINLLSVMHTFTFSRVVQLQIKTFGKRINVLYW